MARRDQRATIGRLLDLIVQNEDLVHVHPDEYRQRAINDLATREDVERELYAGRLAVDAAQVATLVCHVAGLKDPNGQRYRHDGWPAIQSKYLRTFTRPGRALTGDLVFFGAYPHDALAIVRRPGVNPLIFVHRPTRRASFVSFAAEQRRYASVTLFGSIAKL